MPTPTEDFGLGGASSPGQGKEDFDAGLSNGLLTSVSSVRSCLPGYGVSVGRVVPIGFAWPERAN